MSHPPRHALPQSAESFVRFEITGWYLRHLVSPFPNYVSSNSTSTSDIHHSITVLRIINFNAAFIRITTTTQRCILITSATIRSRQEERAWRDVQFVCGCVYRILKFVRHPLSLSSKQQQQQYQNVHRAVNWSAVVFNKQASTTLYSTLIDYTPLPFSQQHRYPEPDGIRHNLRITLLKDLLYLPTGY